MLEKIKLTNNFEMDPCKRILLSMHGHNFFNAVAYLSGQGTKIFPNAQMDNNKKHQLLGVSNGQGQGRGSGRGRWQSNRCNGGGGRGRGGLGGVGHGGYPDLPYYIRNGVYIC